MTLQDAQIHELETLARHEEAIGHLYNVYARKFPEHENFWLKLSNEERNHAFWIRRIYPEVEDGLISFEEGRFKIRPIEISLRYVERLAIEAEATASLEMLQALSIALDIENGLIEKDYLDVYDTDNDEIQIVFNALREASRKHRKRIAELLEEFKHGSSEELPAVG